MIERGTMTALLIIVTAVRDGKLGLRALDEVIERLEHALNDQGRPEGRP